MDIKALCELINTDIKIPEPPTYYSLNDTIKYWTLSQFLEEYPEKKTDVRKKAAAECSLSIKKLYYQKLEFGVSALVEEGLMSKQSENSLFKFFESEFCAQCHRTEGHDPLYACGNIYRLEEKRADAIMAYTSQEIRSHNECAIKGSLEFNALNLDTLNILQSLKSGLVNITFESDQCLVVSNDKSCTLNEDILNHFYISEKYTWSFGKRPCLKTKIKWAGEEDDFTIIIPKIKDVMVDHAMKLIDNYMDEYDIDLEFSQSSTIEIRELVEDVPLTMVSLACLQAKTSYLSAKHNGIYNKHAINIAKSKLRSKLEEFSESTNDGSKYVDFVDIDDAFLDYIYDIIPPDKFKIRELKCLTPSQFSLEHGFWEEDEEDEEEDEDDYDENSPTIE